MRIIQSVVLSGCVALAAPMGAALAADVPLPTRAITAPVGWAGFYVGGTVGWTFGSAKGDYTGALPPVPPPVPAMVFYTFDLKPSGPTVGGHAGYSWQNGPWVFGIEGDISGVFNAHDRAFDPAGSGRYDEVELLWTAHFRGRLGHVFGNCLWYVAGGLALAGVKASHLAPGVQLFSQDDVRTGYSIGGGAEKAFGNWRLRAEYLFDGFASKRYDWVAGTRYSNSDLSLHSVRVGFSYLFGR